MGLRANGYAACSPINDTKTAGPRLAFPLRRRGLGGLPDPSCHCETLALREGRGAAISTYTKHLHPAGWWVALRSTHPTPPLGFSRAIMPAAPGTTAYVNAVFAPLRPLSWQGAEPLPYDSANRHFRSDEIAEPAQACAPDTSGWARQYFAKVHLRGGQQMEE